MKTLHVAAAVICDNLNCPSRIFAAARGYGPQKGGWEFPGGKLEPGESAREALIREIREELAVTIRTGALIGTIEYDYPGFHLSMDCFRCVIIDGEPVLKEAQEARWLTIDTLEEVDWLPADRVILPAIRSMLAPPVRKLYPGGKKRAFSITYDDGVEQDVPFIALLERFGIPGSFNLNSGLMESRFEWVHPCGMTVRRLPVDAVPQLYRNHEVASHTLTHPWLCNMGREEILREMVRDKEKLEALTGHPVCGFAVPFDYYDNTVRDCVLEAGFEYGRNGLESRSFLPGNDYWNWSVTLFHLSPELEQFAGQFLECDSELAAFQLVGHAYDLDADNLWGTIEALLERIHADPDTLSMTQLDLIRYLKAMEQAEISEAGIVNPSGLELWFLRGEEILTVSPGESIRF